MVKIKCKKCRHMFYSQEEIDLHVVNDCIKCDGCLKWFVSHLALQKHKNGKCFPTKCEICDKVFHNPAKLVTHMRSHTNERPFECKLCDKKFNSNQTLRMHVKKLHPNGMTNKTSETKTEQPIPSEKMGLQHQLFVCTVCKKAFNHSSKLVVHMRSHTKEKPFGCPKCNNKFSTPYTMLRHVHKIHDKPIKGTDVTEVSQKPTTKRIRKRGPHVCQSRGKMFTHQCYLDNHMRTHTSVKPFGCPNCDRFFSHRSNLNQHLKYVHKTQFPNNKNFQCKRCLRRFSSDIAPQTHSATVKCLPKRCEICGRDFRVPSELANHLKVHMKLRHGFSTSGRQYTRHSSRISHKKNYGKKCKYCGHMFFDKLIALTRHQTTCRYRNDYQCHHCATMFPEKRLYVSHVRKFCSLRQFNFNCSSCKSSKDFDHSNVLEVLQHVMKCKPKGKSTYFKCTICNHHFKKELISYHIQDELLQSRLFEDIPCTFACSTCEIGFPSQDLLDLHNQLEHRCFVNILKTWDEELGELDDIHIPPQRKQLLKAERKLIREQGLKAYEFDEKVPMYKCYLCLHPYHSLMAMQMHAEACEHKYGCMPDKSRYVTPLVPIGNIRQDKGPKREKPTPNLLHKIYKQLVFEVEHNPHWVQRDEFWGSLENRFNVAPGYIIYWLPNIVKGNPFLENYFKEKLTEVCVIPKSCMKKDKPVIVEISDDEDKDEFNCEIPKPRPSWKCMTCGTVCKSRDELGQHNDIATRYFQRLNIRRKAEIARKEKAIVVEEEKEPTDYDDLELWEFEGKLPKLKCKFCRHPYHSLFAKQLHECVCSAGKGKGHDGNEEDMEWEDDAEEQRGPRVRVLTDALIKHLLEYHRSQFKGKSKRTMERIGQWSYWQKLSKLYDVPCDVLKAWHTAFPPSKAKEEAYFKKELAKVLDRDCF